MFFDEAVRYFADNHSDDGGLAMLMERMYIVLFLHSFRRPKQLNFTKRSLSSNLLFSGRKRALQIRL
jgi:hypothetical protein